MKFPNPFRWLATDDPAPQDFHRWELSEHPDATTEGGAWWCSYGTRHGIKEHCNCAPENVLAAAFPWHPLMDAWAAEDRARDDVYARYRRYGAVIVPATLPGKAA